MRTLLEAGYTPAIIATEVNPDLPPPLLFTVDYDPQFVIASGLAGFFGCSAALWAELGRKFGYAVLQGDGLYSSHDLVLVHTSAIPSIEARYNIALDPLTAYNTLREDYVDKEGAHWLGPRPADYLRASERWGGALESMPEWRESMYLRSLQHSGVFTNFFVGVDAGKV